MTWVYIIFAGSIVYGIADNGNPFTQPACWIAGAIIAVGWIYKKRLSTLAGKLSIAPEEGAPLRAARTDMLEGVRGWKRGGDVRPEVAVASCALGGRDASHIRSLLAIASLRGDDAGNVVAAGARQILAPRS